MTSLDQGESEVIVLALETQARLVIIDEKSARKIAEFLDLPLIGSIGILIEAKKRRLIPVVKPLWDEIIQKGIRFSACFYQLVLHEIGE